MDALRLYLLLTSCILSGCANIPDSYAPPVQRKLPTGAEPRAIGHFAEMGDPSSAAFIVRDVSEAIEGGSWRWARKRPELRFFLETIEGLNLRADFALSDVTMKETGPVTISVFVNGKLLDKIRCNEPGERHFLKPVPPQFLRAGDTNLVALEDRQGVRRQRRWRGVGIHLAARAGFTQ